MAKQPIEVPTPMGPRGTDTPLDSLNHDLHNPEAVEAAKAKAEDKAAADAKAAEEKAAEDKAAADAKAAEEKAAAEVKE